MNYRLILILVAILFSIIVFSLLAGTWVTRAELLLLEYSPPSFGLQLQSQH
ncbi:hypothetical protein B0H19DRAFT_1277856 [Mycena capillaripes]|nr:hypothetical protein B0H19DRAFT_1277856 [Mycena capillaripes]